MRPEEANRLHEEMFRRALEVMRKKRRDYSGNEDPFANFRASAFLGIEPWRGAMLRLMDKLARMQHVAEAGGLHHVEDETLLDTAIDALNYVVITYQLIVEQQR